MPHPDVDPTLARAPRALVRGAHLGERIAARLEQLGMSQKELAERHLKVREATVSDWVSGKTLPRAELLVLLRTVLGMSLDELLGIAEGQDPPWRTWKVFRESPIGQTITEDEERFLKSPLWPPAKQPTAEAYYSLLMLCRHGVEPRDAPPPR